MTPTEIVQGGVYMGADGSEREIVLLKKRCDNVWRVRWKRPGFQEWTACNLDYFARWAVERVR